MVSSKGHKAKQELLDDFECTFLEIKDRAPHIKMSLERRRRDLSFEASRLDTNGFDIGATVEEYGIYPWAGRWQGWPWEPNYKEWASRNVCVMFFGFVRILLSPSARVRCTYRRDKLRSADVELYDQKDGWYSFERHGFLVLPFGRISESIMQNTQMPGREPTDAGEFSPW